MEIFLFRPRIHSFPFSPHRSLPSAPHLPMMMATTAFRRTIGALSTSSSSTISSLWVPSNRFFSTPSSGGESTGESSPKADDGPETTKEGGSSTNEAGTETLDMLVDAALIEAKTLGWTDASITCAAEKLGLSPAAARMIRGGPGELALRYVRQCNERLAKDLSGTPKADSDKTARLLTAAVKTRLSYMEPYHHNWASALRLIATNRRLVLKSTRESALLADELAHHIGYRSPSFIWYTDRAALISLYHATELFWLRDSSKDHVATWTFLSAYAETAVGARKTIGGAVDRVATAHDLASSSVSAVVNSIRRGRGSA